VIKYLIPGDGILKDEDAVTRSKMINYSSLNSFYLSKFYLFYLSWRLVFARVKIIVLQITNETRESKYLLIALLREHIKRT
jgi:hypothetical protein